MNHIKIFEEYNTCSLPADIINDIDDMFFDIKDEGYKLTYQNMMVPNGWYIWIKRADDDNFYFSQIEDFTKRVRYYLTEEGFDVSVANVYGGEEPIGSDLSYNIAIKILKHT